MKLVKMLKDYGVWTKGIHVIDNARANHFCNRKDIDWDYYKKHGKLKIIPLAIELKDFGHHFGRSKHVFIKDGKSPIPRYERER